MNLQTVVNLLTLIWGLALVEAQNAGNYTIKERKALKQFRTLVAKDLYRDFMTRDEYLIRWIRDQDFNLRRAQEKLMTTLKWRKENGIDTILEDEDFSDVEKMCPYTVDARDRVGRPILTASIGSCPVRKIVLGGKFDKLHRMLYFAYEACSDIIQNLQQNGLPYGDGIVIFDISNFNMRDHGCIRCLPIGIDALTLYESYYPQIISQIFVINVPRIAEIFVPIIQPFLSERTKKGLHVYGFNREEWKKDILKFVAPEQLEPQFGGTKKPRKFVPYHYAKTKFSQQPIFTKHNATTKTTTSQKV